MPDSESAVDLITGEPVPNAADNPNGDEQGNPDTPETDKDTKPTGIEKALKDTQRAFHEKAQRVSELEKTIARLEGRMDEVSKTRNGDAKEPEGYFAFLDSEANEKEVVGLFEDPKNADKHTKQIVKRALGGLPTMFDGLKNEILQAVRSELGRATAPDASEVRGIVAELRKDDDLKELDDKSLEILARKRLKVAQKRPDAEYRGSPGSGRSSGGSGGGGISELEKMAQRFQKQMEGGK